MTATSNHALQRTAPAVAELGVVRLPNAEDFLWRKTQSFIHLGSKNGTTREEMGQLPWSYYKSAALPTELCRRRHRRLLARSRTESKQQRGHRMERMALDQPSRRQGITLKNQRLAFPPPNHLRLNPLRVRRQR